MQLDFYSINRYALITRLTRDMVDWINSVNPEDPIDFDSIDGHDDLDVFLIPEFDSIEEAYEWLQENCEPYLRFTLASWCTDEKAWPQPLNWALFERFLEYSLQSVVVDSVDEEYDDEFDAGFEAN